MRPAKRFMTFIMLLFLSALIALPLTAPNSTLAEQAVIPAGYVKLQQDEMDQAAANDLEALANSFL